MFLLRFQVCLLFLFSWTSQLLGKTFNRKRTNGGIKKQLRKRFSLITLLNHFQPINVLFFCFVYFDEIEMRHILEHQVHQHVNELMLFFLCITVPYLLLSSKYSDKNNQKEINEIIAAEMADLEIKVTRLEASKDARDKRQQVFKIFIHLIFLGQNNLTQFQTGRKNKSTRIRSTKGNEF